MAKISYRRKEKVKSSVIKLIVEGDRGQEPGRNEAGRGRREGGKRDP